MRIDCCLAAMLAVGGAGCAAAKIGFQADGTYVLPATELSADCRELHKNIWGRIQLLKVLPAKARAERESAAPTAVLLLGRWLGSSNRGLEAVAEYDRERAHVYALQRVMTEKKCIAVDVDAELAEVSSEMAKIRQN